MQFVISATLHPNSVKLSCKIEFERNVIKSKSFRLLNFGYQVFPSSFYCQNKINNKQKKIHKSKEDTVKKSICI